MFIENSSRVAGLLLFVLFAVVPILSQVQFEPPTNGNISDDTARRMAEQRRMQEERQRADEAYRIARLRAITEGRASRNYFELMRERNEITLRFDPSLTEEDRKAIQIPEDILKKYSTALRDPKIGIVRLQSADLCSPSDLVVQATGGCANNVAGKATSFSFRTGDYRGPLLSDIAFRNGKLSTVGAYTVGMYADLGSANVQNVSAGQDAVRTVIQADARQTAAQLVPGTSASVGIMARSEVPAEIGRTFVLRSIAYKAPKQKNGGADAKALSEDARLDVTVAFQVIRQLTDGSILLIWKELARAESPKLLTSTDASGK